MLVSSRLRNTVTEQQLAEARTFIIESLNKRNCQWTLEGTVLYVNGASKRIVNGYWKMTGDYIYVGAFYGGGHDSMVGYMHAPERLGVLAALIGLLELGEDPEIMQQFEIALGKMLAGVYSDARLGLIQGPEEQPQELAFWESGTAVKIDGEWRNYKGEVVEPTEQQRWVEVRVG